MDPTTATLAAVISILLFAVGFLLGERRAVAERKTRVHDAEPVAKEEPAANPLPIPKAPRRTPGPPSTTGSRHTGIRVVGPQEAILRERQRRDGLVENVPPAVANEFLTEADQINTNSRRQQNG